MLVALFTITPAAAIPPMVTVVVGVKPVPVKVTVVPPATGPVLGLILAKVGAIAVYVKPPFSVALPAVLVTTTSFTSEPLT